MKGVNTNLYTCMALCRNFAKGVDEVAVFKKGVAASSVRGSTRRQCLKKCSLLILRGRDLHKGGDTNSSHPH